MTGTDVPKQTEIGNSIQGTFNRTVVGGGSYSRSETGGTLGSTSSANAYTLTITGNNLTGDFSQNETGADRFGLIEQFDNIADTGGVASPGHMQYHPFGSAFIDEVADKKTETNSVMVEPPNPAICKVTEKTSTSKYKKQFGSDSFEIFGARELLDDGTEGDAAGYHGLLKYDNFTSHERNFGACIFPAGRNSWLISAEKETTEENGKKSSKYTELNWIIWANYEYKGNADGGFAEDVLRLTKRTADPRDLDATLDKLKDLIMKKAKNFAPDPNAKKDGKWLPSRLVV